MSELFPEKRLNALVDIDPESLGRDTPGEYEFYYIDIGSVTPGRVSLPEKRIRFRGAPSRAQMKVQTGDVLMATVRPNLKAFAYFDVTGVECVASTGFAVLRAKADACGHFVYHSLFSDSVDRQIGQRVVGSNYPAINTGDVGRLLVRTPETRDEQAAIAGVLDTVDEAIRQTTAAIEKLRRIKAGLLHDLLTRGIGENGELRDPVAHPEQFLDVKGLGLVPKDWDVKPLARAATRIQDGTHFSPQSKSGPFLYLTSRNVRFGTLDLSDVGRISERDHRFIYSRCPVEYGDVLLTKDGVNTGNAALNVLRFPFSLLSSVAFIRCDGKTVLSRYVLQFLLAPATQRRLKDQMSGNAIPRITVAKIQAFIMPVPSPDEQGAIADVLDAHDARLSSESTTLRKLSLLKQGLMQDLLTGRVRAPMEVAGSDCGGDCALGEKKQRQVPLEFKRSALAAEIVDQMHGNATFGHVKFMKALYLVEQLAEVDLGGNYHRAAAGPLDNRMIRSVDSQMKRQKWFDRVVRATGPDGKAPGYAYVPMEKAGGHRAWFEKYWGGARAKIQGVIDLLRPLDSRRCEIVATLYEAWRALAEAGRATTDQTIVDEVLTNWNESKQAVPRETWLKALGWMREKGLAPARMKAEG